MAVSSELMKKYAKLTKEETIQRETTMYGVTIEYGGKLYVKMDGSDLLTPVVTTSEVEPGERVTVLVKDHTATITGNLSNPSASKSTTDAIEGELSSVVAEVGNFKLIVSDKVTTNELNAEVAKVLELIAIKADIKDLNVVQAEIGNLHVKDAEIDKALITKASIVDLEAAHADIGILEADMATIKTLVGGNLTMNNIQSLVLTSSKVTVDNAFIKDAMIDRVSADKINTGSLNTNLVSIQSEDGSLVLDGSLQQFKDSNGNVRIQIGKDASGEFTFVLYGEDGTGQLINQNGITASAIGDGLIVNDMVADNANISGSKLDIDSVIKTINEDGSETIQSSKIYLDEQGQSLDVAFGKVQTTIDTVEGELTEQIQNNTTSLEVAQGQIEALIANSSITKEDGTIINIKDELNSVIDTVNSHKQTISSLETNYDNLSGEIDSVTSKTSEVEQDLDTFRVYAQQTFTSNTKTDALIDEVYTKINSVEQNMTPEGIMSIVKESESWAETDSMARQGYSKSIQNADKISWVVSGGLDSSSMTLTDDALRIIAENIDLTGKVTFNSFSQDVMIQIGEDIQEAVNMTEIDGGNIKTGTITADKIGAREITTWHIASETITADHIAAGSITADKLSADIIFAPEIEAGSITADHLASKAVTTDKVAAGAITANKIATGAIDAYHIQAYAITGDKIDSYSINSTHIQSGAVTSDKISAYAITGDKIGAGEITANHIAANTITAAEIRSGTITADKIRSATITAAEIAGNTITAAEIKSGTITADKLAANCITADKIAAGAITVDKIGSNSEHPVITLFDKCEIDASRLNGQGKGSAIRFKWDDYNYVYQGENLFALFQSSGGESKIFSIKSNGYNETYLYNVSNYYLTLGDSLYYRNSLVLTQGNYTSYCAKSDHSHSGYASSSHSHSGYASSSHTHDRVSYGSSKVHCYSGYIVFDADSSCYFRMDAGVNDGGAYKFYSANTSGAADLGVSSRRWRTIYATNALNTSDVKYKENIMYIDDIVTYDAREEEQTLFLDFIRDDFRPALYSYKVTREEEGHTIGDDQIGFIANDIANTEVGQTFLYNVGTDDEPDLMYSPTGYTTVVAKALQEEIKVRDAQIAALEARLSALENNTNNEGEEI